MRRSGLQATLILMLAIVAGAVLPSAAPAADRTVTVTGTQNATWNGTPATGLNVEYDSASGTPCGKTPADYCDTTLVHVNLPGAEAGATVRDVEFTATDFSPNPTSDFDLYIYASDANGSRGRLLKSSADVPGAEERTTISDARGYYLVQVVYFAVTQSSYKGGATLLPARDRFPEDDDTPAGLQDILASDAGAGWRSRSEPHIAQSPVDPDILIAASKFYNMDRDSLPEYEFKIGTYVSFDGGRTWGDLGQTNTCPASQAPPSSWPNNTCYPADDPSKGGTGEEDVRDPGDNPPDVQFDDRGSGDFGEEYIVSDAWVDFDDEGNAYLMVLDVPPFATGNGWGQSFHIWQTPSPEDVRSGRTWSNRIIINAYTNGATQELFLDDKNTFAVNNAGLDNDGQTGIIITCWGQNIPELIKQQAVCERSTDGGRTWPSQPIPISDVQQLVIGVHVVADTRDANTFYATWLQYATTVVGAPATMEVAKTTNGGQTWTRNPRPAAIFNDIPRTFPGQSFRNLSLPIAAVGPKGEVYITYAEYRAAPQAGDADELQSDIVMVTSTDGGQTFSAPVKVNQDNTNADQFQQVIDVTPAGQINVAFFDRRLDDRGTIVGTDPGNFFIDTWLARSDDGGKTFEELRLSHDSWDPTINPPISSSGDFIGDYQGLIADNCQAVPFFNDTHLANDASRDDNFDEGFPRSPFQQAFAWRVQNRGALAGSDEACRRVGPLGTGPERRSACGDKTLPRSSVSDRTLGASRRRLAMRGRSTDRACRDGQVVRSTGPMKQVQISVYRKVSSGARGSARGTCRFLQSNGRLSRSRACKDRVWLGTKVKNVRFGKSRWKFSKRVSLPAGRYTAIVRGIDDEGNVERKIRPRSSVARFRVR